MPVVNNDYNPVQINHTVRRNDSDVIIEKSTMINIRTETTEQALKLYQELKAQLGEDLSNGAKDRGDISDSNNRSCPQCGSALLLRTSKNGKKPGSRFYGCNLYPKCKYTEPA